MSEDRLDTDRVDELRLQIDELRRSRARVVAGADTQRRRIERDLHDGALQHLVALAVNLQLARRLADSDLAALKRLLAEMRSNVHEALDEVRQLAWRIYPSLLLDRGLADALRAAAAEAEIPTRLEATMEGRCSPEVEATAYFCCVDVLERASGVGERATVLVRREREALLVEVVVDGVNIEQWARRDLNGVGDRLGALGGGLAIESAAGRTVRISATIPLEA